MVLQERELLKDFMGETARKKYGIAETFTSWQGEGLYTGTRMHFIRFSGCSVGKKLALEDKVRFAMETDIESQRLGIPLTWNLKVYQEKCTLYDGREFLCDTNFQTAKAMSVEDLLHEIPDGVAHVCLTGGEPLDRDLTPLLEWIANTTLLHVHIETSGTVSLFKSAPTLSESDFIGRNDAGWVWLTLAPKFGVLPEMIQLASEIKLLVDEKFDPDKLPEGVVGHELVWLQPVNYENDLKKENLDRCLAILKEFPHWRLSMQAHKIWRVR